MEAIDQNLIERYLANEMTATEKTHFEQRLALETGLQQELEEYKLVMDALRLAERQELLQRFRERDKILDKKNGIPSTNHNLRFWMLSAAAVLTMIIAWRFFIQPGHNADQANQFPKDSTTIQQPLPVQKDTLQRDELKNDKKEEPMAENTKPKKGTELYADNFEPYMDESLSVASRSDEDEMSAIEKFQLAYSKRNFNEALAAFQNLSPAYQENPNLRFLRAIALMALSQFDEATLILNEVSKNPKSKYKTEALYYLALCEVRKGQFDSARKILTNYLGDPDADQKAKAKTLLDDIK
jgi:tetratricopeptide (TPR) repeat protein